MQPIAAIGVKVIALDNKAIPEPTGSRQKIDPFSFYANFNRKLTVEVRKAFSAAIAQRWAFSEDLPSDFSGELAELAVFLIFSA